MELIIAIEGILIIMQSILLYILFRYKLDIQGYFESASKYREEIALHFFIAGMNATEEGGKIFEQVYKEFVGQKMSGTAPKNI